MYGFCESGFLNEENYKKCNQKELTLQEVVIQGMKALPTIPFSFIQSKVDIVQQSFYIAIGVTANSDDKFIYPAKFYDGVNTIFEGYNSLPNFVTYLVDGYQHCFTNMDIYYTADAISKQDDGKDSTNLTMHEWANGLPLDSTNTSVGTVCEGTAEDITKKDNLFETITGKNDYCDSQLVGKVFEMK